MKELVVAAVVVAVVVAAGCDCDEGMITHLRDMQIFMEPGVQVGIWAVSGQHFSIGLPDRPSKGAEGIPKAHCCSLSPLSLGCVW